MVEILLATYNGEKYLNQQLESLKNQTYKNWRIIARDDGSSDGTLKILKEFKRNNPDKIEIHLNNTTKHGPMNNFCELMNLSKSNYVSFCDQDDFWIATKLEKTIKLMKKLEKNFGNLPLLVHTDLIIADKNLNVMFKSMIRTQKLNFSSTKTIKQLIVQNCVTGCTMMANRNLIKICGCIPTGAVMHDWWLAIVACAFGKLEFLDESTIYYRQHEANTIGVTPLSCGIVKKKRYLPLFVVKRMVVRFFQIMGIFKVRHFYRLYRLLSPKFWYHYIYSFLFCDCINLLTGGQFAVRKEIKQTLNLTFVQSEAFFKQYRKLLNFNQKQILKRYGTLFRGNKITRIKNLIRSGYFKRVFKRKLGQIFYI